MAIAGLALNALKSLLPSPKTIAYLTGGTLAGEGLYKYLTGNGKNSIIGSLAEEFGKLINPEKEAEDFNKNPQFLLKKSAIVLGDDMVNNLVANNVSPQKIYETALQVKGVRARNANNPYGLPEYARNGEQYEIDDKGNFTNLTKKYQDEDAARWDNESRIRILANLVDNMRNSNPYTDEVVMPKRSYTSLK